ncbi:hypothetical protein TRAPUB_2301, partial [Trametes pubescens]
NPQQLLHLMEINGAPLPAQQRVSIYRRLIPGQSKGSLRRKPSIITALVQ